MISPKYGLDGQDFLLFSAVLPHKVWRGHGDPRCLDKAHRKVNREMRKAVVGDLGLLPLPDIRVELDHLYCPDGIHMSDDSNDMFLKDLHVGFCAVLGC